MQLQVNTEGKKNMNINLAEKLKSLRKEKNVLQEKLAQYLNVSFQAVSKWENGNAYPDISLLPDIARFFGITVDELLQAEQIDERKLYREYEEKTVDQYRTGHVADTIPGWHVAAAPSDKKQILRALKDELAWDCFTPYRTSDWFRAIESRIDELLA